MGNEQSKLYRQFLASIEPMDSLWIDGFDEEALIALSGKELENAESILLDLLEKGDERAPRALALIGSKAGIEAMRFLLSNAQGEARVILASAIWQATRASFAVDSLFDELNNGDANSRVKAADALSFIDDERTDAVFLNLVENAEDSNVIWAASSGLLYRKGLIAHPLSFKYRDLQFRLASSDVFERKSALIEFRALLDSDSEN